MAYVPNPLDFYDDNNDDEGQEGENREEIGKFKIINGSSFDDASSIDKITSTPVNKNLVTDGSMSIFQDDDVAELSEAKKQPILKAGKRKSNNLYPDGQIESERANLGQQTQNVILKRIET